MSDIVSKLQSILDRPQPQSHSQIGGQSQSSSQSPSSFEAAKEMPELSLSLGSKCPPARKPNNEQECPTDYPNFFNASETLLSEDCCYRTSNPPQHIRSPVVWAIEQKDKTQKPFSSDFQKKVEAAYQEWKSSGKGETNRIFKYTHQNRPREIDFLKKAWIKYSKDENNKQTTQTIPLLRIKRGDSRSVNNSASLDQNPVKMDIEPVVLRTVTSQSPSKDI